MPFHAARAAATTTTSFAACKLACEAAAVRWRVLLALSAWAARLALVVSSVTTAGAGVEHNSNNFPEFLTADDFARAELLDKKTNSVSAAVPGEDGDAPSASSDERRPAEGAPTTTYLSASDFERASKFGPGDLYHNVTTTGSGKHLKNVLYRQRYFRGDIRGKAAWKRNRDKNAYKPPTEAVFSLQPPLPLRAASSTIRRNGVASAVKKWPGGRIPYVLSTQYNDRERAILARAFQEYHGRTCIRFVPRTLADRDFLYIGKIDGCFSDVGRAGGRQELSLDDGCLHLDTVLHELMHSVGFYHEHERWDRDQFISILWDNIDKDAYDQFGRVDLVESSYYGQPYDYNSLMHYDSMAFSRNGRETLIAKVPQMTSVIGSALDFSPVDLEKIRRMYGCLDPLPASDPDEENLPPMGIGTNELPLQMLPAATSNGFNFRTPMLPQGLLQQLGRSSNGGGGGGRGAVFPSSSLLRINNRPREPLPLPTKRGGGLFASAAGVRTLTGSGTHGSTRQQRTGGEQQQTAAEGEAQCADRAANCWRWQNRCRLPFYERLMGEFCARTCGYCKPATNSPTSTKLSDAQMTNGGGLHETLTKFIKNFTPSPAAALVAAYDPAALATSFQRATKTSVFGGGAGSQQQRQRLFFVDGGGAKSVNDAAARTAAAAAQARAAGVTIGGDARWASAAAVAQTQRFQAPLNNEQRFSPPTQPQQQQQQQRTTRPVRGASELTLALAAQAEVAASMINALRKHLPVTHPLPGDVHWSFRPAASGGGGGGGDNDAAALEAGMKKRKRRRRATSRRRESE